MVPLLFILPHAHRPTAYILRYIFYFDDYPHCIVHCCVKYENTNYYIYI